MNDKLEGYILSHIDEEPAELAHIDHDTHVRMIIPMPYGFTLIHRI